MAADYLAIFSYVSFSTPILLHMFGIFILLKTPSSELGSTYKAYFVNLSVAEMVICITSIVFRVFPHTIEIAYLVQYLFGCNVMYLVMIFLTLDRFFRVYWNIKFYLYWNDRRTKILLAVSWILNVALFASYPVVTASVLRRVLAMTFPVYDVLFLIISTVTYTYIFKKIRQNAKLTKTQLGGSVENHSTGQQIDRSTTGRQFMSIFLLVITFTLFMILPDLIYGYFFVNGSEAPPHLAVVLSFVYCMSYTSDFFIYTFGSRPVKATL